MTNAARQLLEGFLLGRAQAGVDITSDVGALRVEASRTVGVEADPLEFAALVYATARKARRLAGAKGMRETREGTPA